MNEHEERRISPSKEKVIIVRDHSPRDSPGSKYILNRSIHEIDRFDNLESSKNYVIVRKTKITKIKKKKTLESILILYLLMTYDNFK